MLLALKGLVHQLVQVLEGGFPDAGYGMLGVARVLGLPIAGGGMMGGDSGLRGEEGEGREEIFSGSGGASAGSRT